MENEADPVLNPDRDLIVEALPLRRPEFLIPGHVLDLDRIGPDRDLRIAMGETNNRYMFIFVILYVRRIQNILCRTNFGLIFSDRVEFIFFLAFHNPKSKKISVCMSLCPIISLCSLSSCPIAFQ